MTGETTTIRPRDEHGRFIAAGNGDIEERPSAELATFEPYTPPFWQERAWRMADLPADKQYTLIALRFGLEPALAGQVATMEQDPEWATVPARRFMSLVTEFIFDADISNRAKDLLEVRT